jgi:phosphopantetheine--protein transferase-like protein
VTGNDIVDIATAATESNWKRKGFLKKIFTPQERQYILKAKQPDKMVWTLWSMKESVYKIYTQQYGGRFFAPQKLNCFLVTDETGQVTINDIIYSTTTTITDSYIYTIANPWEAATTTAINHCFHNPHLTPAKLQQLVYKKIIIYFAASTSKEKKQISIIKNSDGIPFLYCKKEKLSIPVSITHHGQYAAFTIY